MQKPLHYKVKHDKKAKPLCKRAQKQFKQLDMYGKSVALTYKGEETYKSLIGAFASTLIYGTVLAFFLYKCSIVLFKGDTYVAKKSFFKDLDSGQSESFNIGEMGFDYAFLLTGDYNSSIATLEATQVQVLYDEQTGNSTRIRTSLDIVPCENQYFRFWDQRKVNLYGINNFNCVKQKDLYIQGNYYSKEFQYVEIRVRRCKYEDPKQKCASKAIVDSFFDSNQLNIAFINSYFDFNNYTQPIQNFIDDALYFLLDSNMRKNANLYVQTNKALLKDQILTFTEEEIQFTSVNDYREYFDDLGADDNTMAALFIRMDKAFDIYERKIYGVSDLLGDIGGFKESLIMIGLFCVGFFQDRLLNSALLKHVYQSEHKEEKGNSRENDYDSDKKHGKTSDLDETKLGYKQKKIAFKIRKIQERFHCEKKGKKFDNEHIRFNEKEQMGLMKEIYRRFRFNYTLKDMLQYLYKCGCCRSHKKLLFNPKLKKHALFEKGTEKLMHELDCVTLLKSIRQLKLFTQVFLSQNQKLLMKFQKKNVIDSDTSSSDSDDNQQDALKLMDSKNLILSSFIKNKIKNAVGSLGSQTSLMDIDRRILKGVYQKKLKDNDNILENLEIVFQKTLSPERKLAVQRIKQDEEKQAKMRSINLSNLMSDGRFKQLSHEKSSSIQSSTHLQKSDENTGLHKSSIMRNKSIVYREDAVDYQPISFDKKTTLREANNNKSMKNDQFNRDLEKQKYKNSRSAKVKDEETGRIMVQGTSGDAFDTDNNYLNTNTAGNINTSLNLQVGSQIDTRTITIQAEGLLRDETKPLTIRKNRKIY
eukprot:403334623